MRMRCRVGMERCRGWDVYVACRNGARDRWVAWRSGTGRNETSSRKYQNDGKYEGIAESRSDSRQERKENGERKLDGRD